MKDQLLIIWFVYLVGTLCLCPKDPIKPCICYSNNQIVCSDASLDGNALHKVFSNLSITSVDILYIHSLTKLNSISNGTFAKSKFKKIFIENNSALNKIEAAAFEESAVTTSLVIRNNAISAGKDLFEIAKNMATSLEYVEFDRNALTEIPSGSFNTDKFNNLAYIRLDAQKGKKLTVIGTDAFAKLPKLKQLSLDNNGIETLSEHAINLTDSTLGQSGHISIFLNDNKLSNVTKAHILISAETDKPSVGLVLENNLITTIKAGLFDEIAGNQKGVVYLKGNNITECVCEEITAISNVITKHPDGIRGLESNPCYFKINPEVTYDLKCK